MQDKKVSVSGGLRSNADKDEVLGNAKLFKENKEKIEVKLDNFPKYVRRQTLTRFLSLYEIFKLSLDIKGSIIECGVNNGFGLMSWAKFSAILEPSNLMRKVYGFDTFSGFPSLSTKDKSISSDHVKKGDLASNSLSELTKLIEIYDSTRFLGHVNKVQLIKGNVKKRSLVF